MTHLFIPAQTRTELPHTTTYLTWVQISGSTLNLLRTEIWKPDTPDTDCPDALSAKQVEPSADRYSTEVTAYVTADELKWIAHKIKDLWDVYRTEDERHGLEATQLSVYGAQLEMLGNQDGSDENP